jgi:hypothetical protein
MKQRTYRALNIFALCLLLFAGYLNFFRKDKDAATQLEPRSKKPDASKNTVLVTDREQHLNSEAKSEKTPDPELKN